MDAAAVGKKVKQEKSFGLKDKLSYMMGDFGCNCSFALISSYFMLFYVTVIGINPYHFGIIILITKIWDGINDPLIGSLTDYLKPKDGGDKFRPWIKYTALPMTIVTAVMFLYIPDAPYWLKLAQCVITYLLWDICYTCINVPYGSLQSVITSKATERADLSRFRTVGAMLAQIPLMVVLPQIIYVDGNPSGPRFTATAIVLALIAFGAFLILYFNTTERIKKVEIAGEEKEEMKFNYFKTMAAFFRNRPMLAVTLASIAMLLFIASTSTMNQYVFITYFKDPSMLSLGMLLSMGPTLFAMVFVKAAVKKWGKKNICSWPFLAAIACYLYLFLVPIENPYVWFVLQGVAALFTGFNNMLVWALVADCIDYQEWQTGRREEGSIYATYSLFRKLAQGFGAAIIAFLLGLTGYQAALGAEQLPGVANSIKQLAALLPLLGNIISFIAMYFIYNLDDRTLAKVQSDLGHE